MIYAGIDVAKDKHDCFIMNSDGDVLVEHFTFSNDLKGFNSFILLIDAFTQSIDNIKVGLEATGHYSNNILEFLHSHGLTVYVLNPLSTNLYRKGRSLRKTKTDKSDAKIIAMMLITEDLKPYSPLSYHISELKSLSRCRFRFVQERSKFKAHFSRMIELVFPELPKHVWSVTQNSMLHTLLELPSATIIANCHLTKLTNILNTYSKGKYDRDKAIEIRNAAKCSIGSSSYALANEMQHIIRTILYFQSEIKIIEQQIKQLVIQLDSTLLSIPGISFVTAGIILSELGDINLFDSPAKLLAFAGLEPSTYQSGNFSSSHAVMVKRGSKYLRWALLNATRLVCMRDSNLNAFKLRKIQEGKHYFVALSHTAKKLVRIIFHLLKYNKQFCPQ